jgi:hypothetical protein
VKLHFYMRQRLGHLSCATDLFELCCRGRLLFIGANADTIRNDFQNIHDAIIFLLRRRTVPLSS